MLSSIGPQPETNLKGFRDEDHVVTIFWLHDIPRSSVDVLEVVVVVVVVTELGSVCSISVLEA